jgi:hypothetical protein
MRSLICILVALCGCARVPRDATYEHSGVVLRSQHLALPWLQLGEESNGRWCFSRVPFTSGQPWVALEVQSPQGLGQSLLGSAVSVDIEDSKGSSVYSYSGPLLEGEQRIPRCQTGWFATGSESLRAEVKVPVVRFLGCGDARAHISRFNTYCAAIRVGGAAEKSNGAQIRVTLDATWK